MDYISQRFISPGIFTRDYDDGIRHNCQEVSDILNQVINLTIENPNDQQLGIKIRKYLMEKLPYTVGNED